MKKRFKQLKYNNLIKRLCYDPKVVDDADSISLITSRILLTSIAHSLCSSVDVWAWSRVWNGSLRCSIEKSYETIFLCWLHFASKRGCFCQDLGVTRNALLIRLSVFRVQSPQNASAFHMPAFSEGSSSIYLVLFTSQSVFIWKLLQCSCW